MKKNVIFFLTGVLCTMGILFFWGGTSFSFAGKDQFILFRPLFGEIQALLNTHHVPPTKKELEDSLVHALVASYNERFTEYFSPEEMLSFQTVIDGDFEGIGAYIEKSPNGIYIAGVLPGSPSQKAGLLPGDVIQSVDGESMYGMTANEAVQKIRGPAGSAVVLEVFSTALSSKKTVTLIRRKLEIPIITSELTGNILYLQLTSFNDRTGEEVAKTLSQYIGKYSALLLDLRNNGGGTLQASIDVASLFLGEGKEIVSIEGAGPQKHTSLGEEDFRFPIVILVNGQTASAAEILASALRAHLWATIVGSTTYGKGSVQELFPLSNGGQLKITTSHWKTAQGDILDGKGIVPDILILPTAQDITDNTDIQKQQATKYIQKLLLKK